MWNSAISLCGVHRKYRIGCKIYQFTLYFELDEYQKEQDSKLKSCNVKFCYTYFCMEFTENTKWHEKSLWRIYPNYLSELNIKVNDKDKKSKEMSNHWTISILSISVTYLYEVHREYKL